MDLIITEKPSVAKDIASVLGCKKGESGCFEGEKYLITWAYGHLVSLAEPEDYDSRYKKWRLDDLPIIPEEIKLKPNYSAKDQLAFVKKLLNSSKVKRVICATDAGREGELIFRYIYKYCGCKKPIQRLWISSMTSEAIKKGFKNLKPGSEFDSLYESAQARSQADWIVGINATRAFTIQQGELYSIGRVQTPTLAMIVARQKEIDSFTPQKFWEVEAQYDLGFAGKWYNSEEKETRTYNRDEATAIQKKIDGQTGKIVKADIKEKKQMPPLLYDLTSLQRDCNKHFSASAADTLNVAQELYEKHKLITYPRTDSCYLTSDMEAGFENIIQSLQKMGFAEAKYILDLKKLPFSKRIIDDSKVKDHHAIIPTGEIKDIDRLDDKTRRVFSLIVYRTIAAFYPPHKYKAMEINAEIEKETFITKIQETIEHGWKALYEEKPEEKIPDIKKGDRVKVTSTEVYEKETSPPSPYNEGSLLSAMENAGKFVDDEELKEELKESGIGTPATRAQIIERLIEVGYVYKSKKSLHPTDKGKSLIEMVPEPIKSPETTAKWEKALSKIEKGSPSDKFMKSINNYVHFLVEEASKLEKRESPGVGDCPVCGRQVKKNKKGYGCSGWRESSCKFFVGGKILGKNITEPAVKKLLSEGRTQPMKFTSKKGKKFTARLALDGDSTKFEFE